MESQQINKRFSCPEVVPGNGYSPYTGCVVFYAYDNEINKHVTVKASSGIKNVHKTVEEEYNFIKTINHKNVVKVLDFFKAGSDEYMVMEGRQWEFGGGRRNRWREMLIHFDEAQARTLIQDLVDTMLYFRKNNIIHLDVECANLLYNYETNNPLFIDFGRAERREYTKEWLLDQLWIDKITKVNAFFREITNTGGVYVKEPPHFVFDVKPIIKEILHSA